MTIFLVIILRKVGDHILEACLSELGIDSKFNVCTTLPSCSFWMVGDHSGDGG